MLEAVLFDLHGVLTSSPWATLAAPGMGSGRYSEAEVLAVMIGPYDTDGDHPWHRLERGEIGLPEWAAAVMQLAAEVGMELDFSRMRGAGSSTTVNEAMVAKVRDVRAGGRKTGLVTNNVKEMAGGWRALIDVDDLFDVVVDSSHVGLRKPNPAIFVHALEHLGLVDTPDRAVFLDDAPGNVAGARSAGLHAILVEDTDAALAELDELLGEPEHGAAWN